MDHLIQRWERLLMTVCSATGVLDPCPFWLVKASWEVVDGLVHFVFNASFWEGMVLPALKKAVVYLLRKMSSLDPMVLENFHLISNLFFIGKVVDICSWCSATKGPG